MTRKTVKNDRVLRELLDTTAELSAYGLVSKADMARMKVLSKKPPAYAAERVVSIRTEGQK